MVPFTSMQRRLPLAPIALVLLGLWLALFAPLIGWLATVPFSPANSRLLTAIERLRRDVRRAPDRARVAAGKFPLRKPSCIGSGPP